MTKELFAPIYHELEQVQHNIEKELVIKAGYLGSLAHLDFPPLDDTIRPALVILSAQIYDVVSDRVIALAGILQFIFMASRMHAFITEETDNISLDPRDGCQFPVLVGDYLYGKFFTTLCDYDIVRYLGPLAEIIAQINEGGILQKTCRRNGNLTDDLCLEIIRKETAVLFAGCGRLGAHLAGAAESDQVLLEQFGLQLGMAYGLLKGGHSHEQASSYLEQALANLRKLPDRSARVVLERLVDILMNRKTIVCRMVG